MFWVAPFAIEQFFFIKWILLPYGNDFFSHVQFLVFIECSDELWTTEPQLLLDKKCMVCFLDQLWRIRPLSSKNSPSMSPKHCYQFQFPIFYYLFIKSLFELEMIWWTSLRSSWNWHLFVPWTRDFRQNSILYLDTNPLVTRRSILTL